ncbi:MAG: diaminopropionate ammonia-lyase [Pseudomonadota bacterium]
MSVITVDGQQPFSYALNAAAAVAAPWSDLQNDILNDQALNLARQTISAWDGYGETPLIPLPGLAAEIGVAALHYKDEGGRFGLGSFKALGGAYAVLRLLASQTGATMADVLEGQHKDAVAKTTVCCATDGNHGRSVAWGAQRFGCRCVIFLHATVSDGRERAIAKYGAEIVRCDGNYDDSVRQAQETADREGWFVVSDTSYPGYRDVPRDVMQGYEVMAAEAFDAMPAPPTHIFLQTGVGGMAAAIVALAKRRWGDARPVIVLTDPDQSACWVDSFAAGTPTAVEGDLDTLMAGLACGEVSSLAWDILSDHADAAMALTDDAAVAMMKRLAFPKGGDPAVVAGESAVNGLVGLQAGMSHREVADAMQLNGQSRVLVFGTESDTDPEVYQSLVGVTADTVKSAVPAD